MPEFQILVPNDRKVELVMGDDTPAALMVTITPPESENSIQTYSVPTALPPRVIIILKRGHSVPVDMRTEDLGPVAHGGASFIPPAAQSDQLGKTLCHDGGSDAFKGDDSCVLHGFSGPDRSKGRSC